MESKDYHYIRKTFKLAIKAVDKGNHPFSAILVRNDQVIMVALNTVLTEKDVTRHAELNLISEASKNFSREELVESTIYCSTEPCAMCTGAIVWSGIRSIVYGCSAVRLGEIVGESFVTSCRSILKNSNENFLVTGPLLEEEASGAHECFWTKQN